MTDFQILLMVFLIFCAIAVTFSGKLLNSILIYMSFSLIMSIIWITLESPDLAITEAAVGAGVTTILFLVTLKKVNAIDLKDSTEKKKADEAAGKVTDAAAENADSMKGLSVEGGRDEQA